VSELTGDKDFDEVLTQCVKILSVKGKDYTIGMSDRLHNFRTCGEFTGLTPEQTLGVYLYKHIAAVFAYIKGRTESEPIEGRICDIINYMLLFAKMVREKNPTRDPAGGPFNVSPNVEGLYDAFTDSADSTAISRGRVSQTTILEPAP